MKKLNRKGFTLIELLAVIVILAVVMVVTIPSVLSSMDKAKTGQLQNSADSVAEWFQKQYDNSVLNADVDEDYETFIGEGGLPTTKDDAINITADNKYILKTAGLNSNSYITGKVWRDDGKVCVELTANKNSSFYVNSTDSTINTVTNNACSD